MKLLLFILLIQSDTIQNQLPTLDPVTKELRPLTITEDFAYISFNNRYFRFEVIEKVSDQEFILENGGSYYGLYINQFYVALITPDNGVIKYSLLKIRKS